MAERYCLTANRCRNPTGNYQVGQRVWLLARDIPLWVKAQKLAPKYLGPFEIQRVVNPVTVRLK